MRDMLGVSESRLAREFEQHAIVVGSRDEPAELRFPYWDEVEETLRDALRSDDPAVAWTARRACESTRASTPGLSSPRLL